MIQLLLRISEVNHVYDDLSRPNIFYGGEETKIKVENEEHAHLMEDEAEKKII